MCECRYTWQDWCENPADWRVKGKRMCKGHKISYYSGEYFTYTPKALLQWAQEKRAADYRALMQLNEEYYANH